jgi:hypothetical protein
MQDIKDLFHLKKGVRGLFFLRHARWIIWDIVPVNEKYERKNDDH